MTTSPTHLTSSEQSELLGSTTPRLATPPLRDLTPDTSYGFDVIDFARDVLGTPLDPWQEWAAVHLGEMLPDGRPRFRVAMVLAPRQNGKTLLGRALIAYWMWVEQVPLTGITSTDRTYAKRTWSDIVETSRDNQWLARRLGPKSLRLTIGEESLKTVDGAEVVFSANNRRAFRSTTLHRWLCDELREHADTATWDSAGNAQNAVTGAQTVVLTNQGDDRSVVLDALRAAALAYLETGQGDPRLGLLEWSAPDGSDPTDLAALAMANPQLGRRIDPDALLGAAMRAKAAGGEELSGFQTEVMCMRVHELNPAINPIAWKACGTETPIDLAEHRNRVALCFDIALDGSHATLAAAAHLDGKTHTEVVEQWDGHGCAQQLRRELPGIVRRIKPRTVVWFPNGPAAAVAVTLTERKGTDRWPPRGVTVEEIKSEITAVCMGLADIVDGGELVHPDDPMLNAHATSATKLWRGDAWVFQRKDSGPIDGTYAVAGAAHAARALPPPLAPVTVA